MTLHSDFIRLSRTLLRYAQHHQVKSNILIILGHIFIILGHIFNFLGHISYKVSYTCSYNKLSLSFQGVYILRKADTPPALFKKFLNPDQCTLDFLFFTIIVQNPQKCQTWLRVSTKVPILKMVTKKTYIRHKQSLYILYSLYSPLFLYNSLCILQTSLYISLYF